MGIRKSVLKVKLNAQQHVQPLNVVFMLDEHGKEVRVTSHMIQHACHQLLSRCRRIKTS